MEIALNALMDFINKGKPVLNVLQSASHATIL